VLNSQVVQTTRDHDHQVREIIFNVAEHILDNTRTLDTRYRMFNPHAHSRHAAIVSFLRSGQFAPARLFFGWYV
jgi:hypothetical protein